MQTLTYSELNNWSRDIPSLLNPNGKLSENIRMGEYYWDWKGNKIHIDFYPNENSTAKIILLHSFGGTGRLLSFLAEPFCKEGFEIICPDLPPFGLSTCNEKEIEYRHLIAIISDLVDHECLIDVKPVFLLGLGISGMLAYQVAAFNENVEGIIVSALLDQRKLKVRMTETVNKIIGAVHLPALKILNKYEHDLFFPMKELINVKRIVSHKGICQLLSQDEYSWKKELNINFLVSFLTSEPIVEPEYFTDCPVLFAFPENDRWSKIKLSQEFFERIKSQKKMIILKNAGHLPIEEPGNRDLIDETKSFIYKII